MPSVAVVDPLDLTATGLLTGLSLIVAIGAQNAFVLRQGLLRQHVAPVVAVCAVADLALIAAGVAGLGVVVERAPATVEVVRWSGVAFLAGYGVRSLLTARRPGSLEAAGRGARSAGAAVATALALTFLNPHVYLDTVLLLGSIANQHGEGGRWVFAVGAAIGSFVWFFGLGYGARRLAPLFAKPSAWRVLDGLIAVVMTLIALSLALG